MKKYPETPIEVPRFNEENGFYTTAQRSKIMSKIKAKDSKPEVLLRKALWNLGFRYRKNVKTLPGTPDIVYKKYKLVIFIDGEFWHGYNWEEKKLKIKKNRDFWIPKIERNMQRDRINNELLEKSGWHVLRFWAKEILSNTDDCINKILSLIQDDK